MTDSALDRARREYKSALKTWTTIVKYPGMTKRLGKSLAVAEQEADAALARLEAAAREEGYNAGFDKAIKAPAMCGRHDEEVIATVATDRCPGCAIDAAARLAGRLEQAEKSLMIIRNSPNAEAMSIKDPDLLDVLDAEYQNAFDRLRKEVDNGKR